MVTLNDIKQHMLNFFDKTYGGKPEEKVYSSKTDRNSDDYDDYDDYDEDEEYESNYDCNGHMSTNLCRLIYNFWENFDINNNKDFMYVITGEYLDDEMDLDGGRNYILQRSHVVTLFFDYLTKTLNYTEKHYDEIIHNSSELSDELLNMFCENTIEDKIDTEQIYYQTSTFSSKSIVVKYPYEMKNELDKLSYLTYIGNSKIDNISPIYKINLPDGYNIVPLLDDVFKYDILN